LDKGNIFLELAKGLVEAVGFMLLLVLYRIPLSFSATLTEYVILHIMVIERGIQREAVDLISE